MSVMVPIVSVALRNGTIRYVKDRPMASFELVQKIEGDSGIIHKWVETTQGFVRASEIVSIEDSYHESSAA